MWTHFVLCVVLLPILWKINAEHKRIYKKAFVSIETPLSPSAQSKQGDA
jgi:hypothetical protein